MTTLITSHPVGDSKHRSSESERLFEKACKVFPDGMTRATIEKDPFPRYMAYGEGAYLYDVDGNQFLDLNGNFTTLIHGHGFQPIVEAVQRQLSSGSCFANPTVHEIALAETLSARIPNVDQVRFVNSGTEAVMFAIKAARAFTGRPGIAKFEGSYHGAYDCVEVSQAATPENWGSKENPNSVPFYHGAPKSVLDETVVLRFNDAPQLEERLKARAGEIAAVLVDPMPSRAGLIPPEPEFLNSLHNTCHDLGIVIISDEVLNLRQGYQGASARYGLQPDLLAMGKIIGGGLPIGAIGGRTEIMKVFTSENGRPRLPQGGTFSANPLSMVAGLASMEALDHQAFEHLESLGVKLRTGLSKIMSERSLPFSVSGGGSLFRIHPTAELPREFRDTFEAPRQKAVMKSLTRFFASNGVILPNAAAGCLSTPMTEKEIDLVIDIFDEFVREQESEIAAMETN